MLAKNITKIDFILFVLFAIIAVVCFVNFLIDYVLFDFSILIEFLGIHRSDGGEAYHYLVLSLYSGVASTVLGLIWFFRILRK